MLSKHGPFNLALGIVSCLPALVLAVAAVAILVLITWGFAAPADTEINVDVFMLINLFLAIAALSVALWLFYIASIFLTGRVPRDERMGCLSFLLIWGPVGMPLFWYRYYWRQSP